MHLPLFLLLLIADITLAHDVRHHLRRAHTTPTRKPRSLARDLRIALGGIMLPRDTTTESPEKKPVVYCKPAKQVPFDNGNTGGGGPDPGPKTTSIGGNSTVTRSSSTRRPSSTQRPQSTTQSTRTPTSVPSSIPTDSPWRLTNSYVRIEPPHLSTVDVVCSLEIRSLKDGISSHLPIRRMVCKYGPLCDRFLIDS